MPLPQITRRFLTVAMNSPIEARRLADWLDVVEAVAAGGGVDGALTVGTSGAEQYTTITAALAVASSGDEVVISKGTYAEDITIPDGVRVRGNHFAQGVIIDGTVTFAGSGTLREITVRCPDDGSHGIVATLAAGKLTLLVDVVLLGTGGSGDLVRKDGAGILAVTFGLFHNGGATTGAVIRVLGGTFIAAGPVGGNVGSCADFFKVDGGTLLVPQCVFQSSALYTATDFLDLEDGAAYLDTILAPKSAEPFTNCVHISGDGVTCEVYGSPLRSSTYDLLIDGALAGTGTTIEIEAPIERSKYSAPAGYRDVAVTSFNFEARSGWASYTDTTHTSGSPQTFSDGVRAQWTNNAGSKLVDYRPGKTELWSGNLINPGVAGEAYELRIDFTYQPSASNSYADLILDIGSDPLGAHPYPEKPASDAGQKQALSDRPEWVG